MPNKNRLTALIGATVIAVAAMTPLQSARSAEQITVMTWGGHWLDIFRPVADKFEEETGTKVEFVVQAGAADGLSKLIAQRNSPQVDIWTSIESTVKAASEADLLAELDPAEIPNMEQIPSDVRSDTGVAIWLSPRGIFYRKDLVPFEITEWEDLWDERLSGQVGTTIALDRGSFLIMAALLNEGSEHDIDKGFEKVAELSENLHAVYKTDPESIRLLETGEIAVAGWGILPNVYRHLGPDSNYEFVMPKPRFLATIPVSIVAGRGDDQLEAAQAFVNYMLEPEAQEIMTEIAGTLPANPAAEAPEKLRGIIPPLPISDVYSVDWDVVNENFSEWEDRWMQEIQVR